MLHSLRHLVLGPVAGDKFLLKQIEMWAAITNPYWSLLPCVSCMLGLDRLWIINTAHTDCYTSYKTQIWLIDKTKIYWVTQTKFTNWSTQNISNDPIQIKDYADTEDNPAGIILTCEKLRYEVFEVWGIQYIVELKELYTLW